MSCIYVLKVDMDNDSLLMINETFQKIWEKKNKQTQEYIDFLKERLVKEQVKNDKLGIEKDELNDKVKQLEKYQEYEKDFEDFLLYKKLQDKQKEKEDYLRIFMNLCQVLPDIEEKGVTLAPTEFEDFFYHFKCWSKNCQYPIPNKKRIKDELIKWQNNTHYGLKIGKRISEKCKNGTYMNPRFNLVHYSDEKCENPNHTEDGEIHGF